MIQYFLERPYLIFLMVALVALTVFVCIKAGQASSRHSKEVEKIMKKLKEENVLRNEFSSLTVSLIDNSDPARLFKGVALNLQKNVSDAEDMNAEFEKLGTEQKYVYALSFIAEDGGEKLSEFFRANGQPLTGVALDAVKKLFDGRVTEIFEAEYKAFDSDNEEVSFIASEIDALDAEFAKVISAEEFSAVSGRFITASREKFI